MAFWRKAEVEIVPERAVYVAGETVRIRARIWGKGDLALEEARVELRENQHYNYERRTRDDDGRYRWSSESTSEQDTIAAEQLFGAGRLTTGQFFEYYVSFNLPVNAAPSGETGLLRTSWQVALILNRHRALDVNTSAAITILAPGGQSAARIASGARCRSAKSCAVLPHLPKRDIRVGSTIAGTIIVFARQPVRARQVRVELVRIEETVAPNRSDSTRSVTDSTTVVRQPIAGGGDFPLHTPWGFPFALAVPPDLHPTAFTSKGTVRWLLRGVIDRSFAEDYSGAIEVNIYNGPPLPPLAISPDALGAPLGAGALDLPISTLDSAFTDDTSAASTSEVADMTTRFALEGGITGPLAGQIFPLGAAITTLGRGETNTIVVPDPAVSREHAEIRAAGPTFILRDLASTGGTYVNGEPLTSEYTLRPDDIIGLGPATTLIARIAAPGDG